MRTRRNCMSNRVVPERPCGCVSPSELTAFDCRRGSLLDCVLFEKARQYGQRRTPVSSRRGILHRSRGTPFRHSRFDASGTLRRKLFAADYGPAQQRPRSRTTRNASSVSSFFHKSSDQIARLSLEFEAHDKYVALGVRPVAGLSPVDAMGSSTTAF